MEKLTAVTIHVPYRGAGNVIQQQEVAFEVYRDINHYSIKPKLTEMERRLANLPEALDFHMIGEKAISSRGLKDGNLHVIQDVVVKLREQKRMV